jgi:threonine aldolase
MTYGFRIDLRSDTKTKPSAGMRAAMATAAVGDEQLDEDPSVNALTARVAALTGKSRGLFLPSGTMCNLIAVLVHCRPGDEVIAADISHLISSESGGAAAIAGTQIRPVRTERGIFTAEQAEAVMRPKKINAPATRLIHVEQTVNRGGGAIWPIDTLRGLASFAREQRLPVHMDGARLMNAVVGSGVAADEFGNCCDSLWLDLSKGLGCPVGAVLVGDDGFIDAARRWKFRLGGAMRQAGVIASAGLYALDHHVERLRIDHENAYRLAESLKSVASLSVWAPETNLVFFEVDPSRMSASELERALPEMGIGIGVEGTTTLRAVTHLDVDAAGIKEASAAIARILG